MLALLGSGVCRAERPVLPLAGRHETRLGPRLCHAGRVGSGLGGARRQVLDRLASLRQHQRDGQRSPHKPLLVLLALGRLAATGSSELPWSTAESELANLIADFGPPSRTSRAQSAAYPFTRLRADGVWVLNQDVQMDLVGPLASSHVTGRLEPSVESALRDDPALIPAAARALVLSNFPETVAPDVLAAVGLEPDAVPSAAGDLGDDRAAMQRRRSPAWRLRCCRHGTASVHSADMTASCPRQPPGSMLRMCAGSTSTGRTTWTTGLLCPRPGTITPSADHITWHTREVFKGKPIAA